MRVGGFTIPVTFDGLTLLAGLLALAALASLVSGVIHIVRERRLRPFRIAGVLIRPDSPLQDSPPATVEPTPA